MVNRLSRFIHLTALVLALSMVAACAAPAATPTATPQPVAKPAPAPTKAAATPAPVALRWEGGKLQPLPDGWPQKAISINVDAPGETNDTLGRALAKAAQPLSPVTVAVVNHGAGIGLPQVILSLPPDGYRLMPIGSSVIFDQESRDLGFLYTKDFKPIMTTHSGATLIGVPTGSPFRSVKELVDFAKANPGKVRVSTRPPGTTHHVGVVWLGLEAGVNWVVIPTESGTAAITTMVGGGSDASLVGGVVIAKQMQAGKARPLAELSSIRSQAFADIPTFKQAGYNVSINDFRFLLVRAGVPDERVEWLHELFKKAAENLEYQKAGQGIGLEAYYLNPKDTAKEMAEEASLGKSLLERLGIAKK